jgi:hypothetical protein
MWYSWSMKAFQAEQRDKILEMMRQAWPENRFKALGPNQKKLLKADFMTTSHSYTVEHLRGMLEMVEDYFPEGMIDSEGSLKEHLQIASE